MTYIPDTGTRYEISVEIFQDITLLHSINATEQSTLHSVVPEAN